MRTILELIIQLIYYKFCSCIYRICSDRHVGYMDMDNITVTIAVNILQCL